MQVDGKVKTSTALIVVDDVYRRVSRDSHDPDELRERPSCPKKTMPMDRGGQLLHLLTAARGADLESILGDLEMFLNLPYLAAFQCNPEYVTTEAATVATITITKAEAARLRSTLRHEIIREYRSIDRDALVAAYEPLFDLVFSYVDPAKHCLPIFTTNYDLAIETLCETLSSQVRARRGS